MPHAVVHFEIGGQADDQLAEFYATLFGWQFRPVPGGGYTLIDTSAGGGINGGISQTADGEHSVRFYIQSDDLQAMLDKINLLGGKTVTPITELAGMVTYALFEDLDGLVTGLVLATGEPAMLPSAGPGAAVDWFEVLGADPDRSQRFYTEIFGWQTADTGGYRMVNTGADGGIHGGIGAAESGSWATVYASVPDVEAVLAQAEQLGGSRVYGPNPVDDHMQTGALRDPAGNVFGVYHHAPHDG
jgi:predicted enzyme related to lactoylglutathione lyase